MFLSIVSCQQSNEPAKLTINEQEYLEMPGLNVMLAHDFYPEGHQGGVSIIHHGVRMATNGDLRLDVTPGQWTPVPKPGEREVDLESNTISVGMAYPDSSRIETKYNPIIYPDLHFDYTIRIVAEGSSFRIIADLEKPLPSEWIGKVGFLLELYPGEFFGKGYYMDDKPGIFPMQPTGPITEQIGDETFMEPLATGKVFTLAPESETQTMVIESLNGEIQLIDGRQKHNNGWYILRSIVPANATIRAVEWLVKPHVIPNWVRQPVVQLSQVGYHPEQEKIAVIELDKNDRARPSAQLMRIQEDGSLKELLTSTPEEWGRFLRYDYLKFDFTEVKQPGMYLVKYGDQKSHHFQIQDKVFDREVWQPTLEYYLPVQMCHMRINENYRVWHGLCHMDDALMAPVDTVHVDAYAQGPSTLTKYKPYEPVPGLNVGGWHDAGDYDLRVESQSGTVHLLAMMYEEFGVNYDNTSVDQQSRVVEMLQPDGINDMLQQIEHGVLTIVAGYRSLGRLYRGIIAPSLRQYVMLGDGINMSDNEVYRGKVEPAVYRGMDDRWVFTEVNPRRELRTIPGLAIAGRVLKDHNPELARECLSVAESLWENNPDATFASKATGAAELFLSTRDSKYLELFKDSVDAVCNSFARTGSTTGRILQFIDDEEVQNRIITAAKENYDKLVKDQSENPYGVPYRPHIWGAGWGIQRFGVQQYFLNKCYPDIYPTKYMLNALNFVLGCHPGSNTASFASGVGSNSLIVAYGVNRADWSFIPGGVASGTALIRPDFPELKNWPFFWQQTEYVMGGGATNFMFLALAANELFGD
jgi:hypothetical protein